MFCASWEVKIILKCIIIVPKRHIRHDTKWVHIVITFYNG